ncbi:MAG TPA: VOC family protein [Tepidanaerobacteraceae bacterium]|nr:VOC family protein [Tepidanaerobacteraceae bacterium]
MRKFLWATITVKDMEESLKFYQEIVGLTLDRRYQARPGVEIAFLGSGETKVELIKDDSIEDVNIGEHISLGFEVDSVDGMMKFLGAKGIPIHSGPFQPNPSIKFFYIKDPNGLNIQFFEHID